MITSIITFLCPALGALLIIFYVLKNWNNIEHKNLKRFILPLAIIFGIFGYSMYFNGKETDLTRYYDIVNLMSNYSLKSILLKETDLLYTKDLLFYFVSRINDVNILSFIVGFIIYGITFYILFDSIENSTRKFKTYEIFLMGIICIGIISPYSIIGNVRCITAYSIISLAAYRDLVKRKRNLLTLLLYLIPIGLHTSAVIIIFIRIVSQLLKSFNKIALLVALLLPNIIDFTYEHIKFGMGYIGEILNNAISKAYYYLHWTEGGWASKIESSISNSFFRISGSIFLIAIIIIILAFNHNKKNQDDKKTSTNLMVNYLLFVAILALGTLTIKTGAFWRFESIVVLFSPVIFVNVLENNSNLNKYMKFIYLFGIVMLLINVVYQVRNLTELGFLITLGNFLTTSGLKILWELIKGIIYIL